MQGLFFLSQLSNCAPNGHDSVLISARWWLHLMPVDVWRMGDVAQLRRRVAEQYRLTHWMPIQALGSVRWRRAVDDAALRWACRSSVRDFLRQNGDRSTLAATVLCKMCCACTCCCAASTLRVLP